MNEGAFLWPIDNRDNHCIKGGDMVVIPLVATEEEIQQAKEHISTEHPSDYSDKVKETLINIVNKYLPVNVKYFEPNDSSVVFEQTSAVIYIV